MTSATGEDGRQYRPIACSLHDRFEAACVRRRAVAFRWNSGETDMEYEGLIRDIRVEGGAEFLILEDAPPVRLDWIESFEER